jgi:hypothetical protein
MAVKLTIHGMKQKLKGKKNDKTKYKFGVTGVKGGADLVLKGKGRITGIDYKWTYKFPAGSTDGNKDVDVECKDGQDPDELLRTEDIVDLTVTITNPGTPLDEDTINEVVDVA